MSLTYAHCVIFGDAAAYALRGSAGDYAWHTDSTKSVPQVDPCVRCAHRDKCRELGGGKIDVVGCLVAEGWRDAAAAYAAAFLEIEAAADAAHKCRGHT